MTLILTRDLTVNNNVPFVKEDAEAQRVQNLFNIQPPTPRGLSKLISISTNDQACIFFPKQGTPIKPHGLFGRPQGF